MYKKSVKDNSQYLIPFVEGIKFYGSDNIINNCGTMIILNNKGDILTCAHIAYEFANVDTLNKKYPQIISELKKAKNKGQRSQVEKKYSLKKDTPVLARINIHLNLPIDCPYQVITHKYLDLALIRFKGVDSTRPCYPIFSDKFPEQGQNLCKLGYPFPEYDIFEYSGENESIIIKSNARENYPIFPLDGIMTRGINDGNSIVSMFEMSTPGLKGQSGGPIFSPEGVVYGIQCATEQLDLNLDVSGLVTRGIEKKRVNYTPFINLGVGISSVEIIKFLEENGVEFQCK